MADEQARREGWFRSPGGVLAHADGPSQVRAFVDRGYVEVSDDVARKEIGDGITLTVDRTDAKGTFDAESVKRAVKDESTGTRRAPRKRTPRKATAKPPADPPPAGDSAPTD